MLSSQVCVAENFFTDLLIMPHIPTDTFSFDTYTERDLIFFHIFATLFCEWNQQREKPTYHIQISYHADFQTELNFLLRTSSLYDILSAPVFVGAA